VAGKEERVDDNARVEFLAGKRDNPRRGRRVGGTLVKVAVIGYMADPP
jgi:hypothetical protein